MNQAASPDLSILVVSYNCAKDVLACVESVRSHVKGLSWELLIRDNASRDVDQLRQLEGDGVRLVAASDNPGFGVANNLLAKEAAGEFLVCLNPDTILQSDALTPLVGHLREHPECGAAGITLRNPDGSIQFAWAPPTDLLWDLCEAHYLQGLYRRCAKAWLNRIPADQIARVGFVSGACLCLRRNLFLDLGGFDPDFFMNHEDVELCDRVRARGLEVHLLRHLSLVHNESTSQRKSWRNFAFHRLHGKWVYIGLRYGGWRLLVARAIWWENVLLRLATGPFLLRGAGRTRIDGYLDAVRWVLGKGGS